MKLIRIGRAESNERRVDDKTVSRRHAELVIAADGVMFLIDCASTGGTFVLRGGDWVRIRQDYVEAKDRIRLGSYEVSLSSLTT
jgi:pSer/pThr/pTyr-binding forkhead associated (FHA) protein